MMATCCRPTSVADEGRLAEFLSMVFATAPNANFVDPLMLRWKYWIPREDSPEPRSFVMEQDGRIVAHVGLWPVTLLIGARSERGIHPIDWAADPEARGAGVSLLMSLAKNYDFVFGIGGSEMTRAILPKLGFRIVATAATWARPIRPWRQMLMHQNRDWRLPLRFARNFWWSRIPSGRNLSDWSAVEPGADNAGRLVLSASERGTSFFQYLQQCPLSRILTFNLVNEGRVVGSFALSVVGEQTRVAGVWLENAAPEIWRIAFSLAQDAAWKLTNTCELIARCTTEASAIAAEQAGMRLREQTPVFLLRKEHNAEPLPMQYHLADNDALFSGEWPGRFLT